MAINKGMIDARVSLDTQGYTVVERYSILASAVVTTLNLHIQFSNALVELNWVPFDPHPFYGQECVLLKISPEVNVQDKRYIIVTTEWGPPDYSLLPNTPQIRVGATAGYVETNVDRNGTPLVVSYTYPNEPLKFGKSAGQTYEVNHKLSVMHPEKVLEFSTKEYVSPEATADTFVGWVNDAIPWKGYPQGTVLCTGIVGTSVDGGYTWAVQYTFQFRSDGWKDVVMFEDKFTGHHPSDLIDGTGKKEYWLYKEANFNLMVAI